MGAQFEILCVHHESPAGRHISCGSVGDIPRTIGLRLPTGDMNERLRSIRWMILQLIMRVMIRSVLFRSRLRFHYVSSNSSASFIAHPRGNEMRKRKVAVRGEKKHAIIRGLKFHVTFSRLSSQLHYRAGIFFFFSSLCELQTLWLAVIRSS